LRDPEARARRRCRHRSSRKFYPGALQWLQAERTRLLLQHPCTRSWRNLQIAVLELCLPKPLNRNDHRVAVGVGAEARAKQAIELVVIDARTQGEQRPVQLLEPEADRLSEGRRRRSAIVAPGVDFDLFQFVARSHVGCPLRHLYANSSGS